MKANVARCEVWYDRTWWETDLPDAWTFRQDKSIKGWPYLYASTNGTQLWIKAAKHTEIPGWDFTIAPAELSEEEKKAYLLAASDASQSSIPPVDVTKMSGLELAELQHQIVRSRPERMAAGARVLTRHDVGTLVGFTYRTEAGWTGYFVHAPWMLNVACLHSATGADENAHVLAILASLRFRGAQQGVSRS